MSLTSALAGAAARVGVHAADGSTPGFSIDSSAMETEGGDSMVAEGGGGDGEEGGGDGGGSGRGKRGGGGGPPRKRPR